MVSLFDGEYPRDVTGTTLGKGPGDVLASLSALLVDRLEQEYISYRNVYTLSVVISAVTAKSGRTESLDERSLRTSLVMKTMLWKRQDHAQFVTDVETQWKSAQHKGTFSQKGHGRSG